MNKLTLILLMICTHTLIYSQIPAYKWAYSIGDVSEENIDALVTDNDNNILIGGQMYNTTDMDPTEFSEVLDQVGMQDAFIEKFDEDGNVMWGINFGGPNYDGIYKMAVDKDDNVYAIGYFAATADLDYDIVDQGLVVSHGGYDMFLVKYDKNGKYVWGRGFGGTEDDWINNITIDNEENIYITGQFKGIVDFDGTADGELEINSTLDLYDGFLAKYDTDGEISWVFRMGGFYDDFANEVVVDHAGDIIVTGTFQGTADFDGAFLEAADGTMIGWPHEGDAFIAKYTSDADLVWAKSIVGSNGFNGGYSNGVNALAVDIDNNIYVTGLIYGEGDFDMNGGEHIITTYSDYDSYLAKYNSEGDLSWAHTTAPKVIGYNLDMVVDFNSDIYLTGDFGYSAGAPYEADFDFNDDSIYALQSLGEKDVYIAKYDSSAELLWAFNMGGSGWDYATAIALDKDYNICVGGWFFESDDFDANPDSNFIWLPYTSPSYGDNIWMGKYDQDITIVPSAINEINNAGDFILFPNPVNSLLNITFTENEEGAVFIYDVAGRLVATYDLTHELNVEELTPGIYLVDIITTSGNNTTKIIKQ